MKLNSNMYFKMKGWETLTVAGPAATDFLNRITSTNFSNLAVGQWSPGFMLSATGKPQLFFKALYIGPQNYLFLVPPETTALTVAKTGSASEAAVQQLETMHFMDKLTMTAHKTAWQYLRLVASQETLRTLPESLRVLAPLAEKPMYAFQSLGPWGFALNENRWNFNAWDNQHRTQTADLGLLIAQENFSKVCTLLEQTGFQYSDTAQAEQLRILAGDPQVPTEINATLIPLEAELADSVHEGKGCYPGQEVIERLRSQGQAPRKLVYIKGTGTAPTPQSVLRLKDQDVGLITSVTSEGVTWQALGFIRRINWDATANYTVLNQAVSVKLPQAEHPTRKQP